MKSTHVKVISIKRNVLPVVFDMVQLTTGNVIAFHIRDVAIPGGTTAKAFFEKPSGRFVYKETGITVSGQQITLPIDNQSIAEVGLTKGQVTLYNGADTLSSFEFVIHVFPSIKDMLIQNSETVIPAFEQAVQSALDDIEAAKESAEQDIGTLLDPTLTQENKAAEAKATGEAIAALDSRLSESIAEISDSLSEFSYHGKFSPGSKYSTADISIVPKKGDLIFFRADENNSTSFLSANLFLYYTDNDYDLVTITKIGDYKMVVAQKDYIKALVNNALTQTDTIAPTWKATVMSSGEHSLSGSLMLFYSLLNNGIELRKEDIENLKTDFISKNSKRVVVRKDINNTYIDFPVLANDKGFIFVADTNASKFTAYDLYGHKPDDTFEVIKSNISVVGNIYMYDNNKGYDYFRIIFRC